VPIWGTVVAHTPLALAVVLRATTVGRGGKVVVIGSVGGEGVMYAA
jgi:hypothetical protein